MQEKKRFKKQNLDKKEYENIEYGVKVVKSGMKMLVTFVPAVVGLTKYGPEVLKNIRKLHK